MDVRYTSAAAQPPERLAHLKRLSAELDGLISPQSKLRVSAEWDVARTDKGREVCRLTLEEPAGRVSADFTEVDLAIPLYMRVSLALLWDDLLRIRSAQSHAASEASFAALFAEGE